MTQDNVSSSTAAEPNHLLPKGLGVVEHRGRIAVYQMDAANAGPQLDWVRYVGEALIDEVPVELKQAILEDWEKHHN